ncbi:MAG: AAA-like domain-containing protein, partial [Candidatus Thorarchaeota archaeon]
LSVDPEAWWEQQAMGPVQRFTGFLRAVTLAQIEGRAVIFIDELDSTLKLDFSDDFFAAIRACYNKRASDPAYNRLTFVLLGVATPSDFIKDRSRTPFNIGQGIELGDLRYEDAQILREGLEAAYPEEGDAIFKRIFYWTNGHPYLTQKLCLAAVEDQDGSWTNLRVDELVEKLFLAEEARKETNLQFVRDRVTTNPRRRELLDLYRQVHEGKEVRENERSLDQNRLRLFGLVQAEGGVLKVRNTIYHRVFDLDWIKENTPVDWTQRIAIISTVLMLFLAVIIGIYVYQRGQRTAEALAQTYETNFKNTTNPTLRLDNLAKIFDLPGFEDRARSLFDSLRPEEKISLFTNATPDLQPQVRTVVKGTYTHLGDSEPDHRLLQAMHSALDQSGENSDTADEIAYWLEGRNDVAEGKSVEAIVTYGYAINLNSKNAATYFERALVLASMGEYQSALSDLETVLRLDEERQERVRQTLESNDQLYTALWGEPEAYENLIALVPMPTSPPPSTSTPTPIPVTETPTTLPPTSTPTSIPSPVVTATPTRPRGRPPIRLVADPPNPFTHNGDRERVFSFQWDGGCIEPERIPANLTEMDIELRRGQGEESDIWLGTTDINAIKDGLYCDETGVINKFKLQGFQDTLTIKGEYPLPDGEGIRFLGRYPAEQDLFWRLRICDEGGECWHW